MKKLSFAAGVAAIALSFASIFPAAGVYANTIATGDLTGNPITLKRSVSGITNPVTNTFTYAVTSSSVPSGATVTSYPTSATINFNNVTPTGGTAEQSTTLDFASANYSAVGDYEFTITETTSSNPANYPVDTNDNDYTAIVQVRYYTDPTTNVPDNSRYVASIILNNNSDNKVSEATWVSGATYTFIEAAAKTTGNMAETDECFAYTIDILTGNGVTAGDEFTIETASTCAGSDTSVTAGSPSTVYLRHGDTVTIGKNRGSNQLPVGARYTWTKASDSTSGYTNLIDGAEQASVTKTAVATTNTLCNDDTDGASCWDEGNHTDFENTKGSDPLTGIVTNFWFYLALLMIGLFGFIVINRKRKEEDAQQA